MKKALVIGGARSGNSVVKLLLSQGYEIIWADDHKINVDPEIDPSKITFYENGIPFELKDARVDIVVKNPGIPSTLPVVSWLSQRYFIYSEVDVAYLAAKKFEYGAITGTNGKTTTTALLHHLLSDEEKPAYVAGNIGCPLSDIALNHGQEEANIALELSSFQIDGLLFFKPKVATILNLSPDHLDRYYFVDKYYDSKFNLLKNMDYKSVFLKNLDDSEIVKRTKTLSTQIITFSLKEKADVYLANDLVYYHDQLLFDIETLPIKGPHNIQNAMVAVMMAKILGVDLKNIQRKLKSFTGVKHRFQKVAIKNEITYYNDSKATNPESTIAALRSFDKPVILLLGGFDKKISYQSLVDYKDKMKRVIAFGETKEQIKELFEDAVVVETLQEAFYEANQLAQSGDVVLLSPASASFDQYKNFEERGDHFIELVNQL